jgi:N-acetylmuramoyl-L-alanine amidase
MGNVEDFLRYRLEARVLFPVLKPFALVSQTGTEISWEHFNSANIPQYNVPLGFDVNANQVLHLVGYHEPGHELEETLRLSDPTMAHRQKFLTLIGVNESWVALKAAADAQTTPSAQHKADPGEWWADAFANAVAGMPLVGPWQVQAVGPLKLRTFFQSLIGIQPAPAVEHSIEWLGPVPTSNYTRGRGGNDISLIVDHWMVSTFEGALAHFMNGGAQVSAHFLISQGGRIVQVVRDEDTAYHCGNWMLNQQSIGIEHEGGPNLPPMTPELYAASAWLHRKLSLDYGIRLVVGETVRRHSSIVPTQCPGTLDLDRLVNEAGGGDDMTEAEVLEIIERNYGLKNTIAAMKQAYDPLVPLAHPKTHEHTLEGKAK